MNVTITFFYLFIFFMQYLQVCAEESTQKAPTDTIVQTEEQANTAKKQTAEESAKKSSTDKEIKAQAQEHSTRKQKKEAFKKAQQEKKEITNPQFYEHSEAHMQKALSSLLPKEATDDPHDTIQLACCLDILLSRLY